MIDLSRATPTLRARLLSKIVMPGPATPCATWVGGYSLGRRRTRGAVVHRRPVIQIGGRRSPVAYVARVVLTLAADRPSGIPAAEACHRCPTGTPVDAVYRCVDLDHLYWGSRTENERDKHGE